MTTAVTVRTAQRVARVRRLAWSAAGFCFVLSVPTVVLILLLAGQVTPGDGFGLGGFGGLAFLLAGLAFSTTGAAVASMVRANSIGWLFCVIGLCLGIGTFTYQYADYALYVADPVLPGGTAAALLQNFGLPPAFGLLGLSLLLFPDGRLPSQRWWPAALLSSVGIGCIVAGYALRPGVLDFPFDTVRNPIGLAGTYDLTYALSEVGWLFMAAGAGVAAIAMIRRLRRSCGEERQQLKWIALVATVVGVVLVANVISFLADVGGIDQLRIVVVGLTFAAFPIAAAIAILRYRLYDIDVVINRTLVYLALTATLAATYFATVLLLQFAIQPLTERSDLAVAGSTLAVAALFRPARRRIQGWVDRRFYRSRYDATQTLAEFSGRLREQIDLDALGADLQHVVRDTVAPVHVTLWLREAGQ